MKFDKVIKGKKSEDPIEVRGFEDADGKPFIVLAVPLTGLEYETACAAARARAIDKGVPNPSIGDPIYDMALQAFVLSQGCVDPESDPASRQLSFRGGHQILDEMQPETIVYLHERHELHQSMCSPYAHTFKEGDEGLRVAVSEVAGPEGKATFMRWSPSMRLSFSTSMARQLMALWDSQKDKSGGGSVFDFDMPNDESKSVKPSHSKSNEEESPKPTSDK